MLLSKLWKPSKKKNQIIYLKYGHFISYPVLLIMSSLSGIPGFSILHLKKKKQLSLEKQPFLFGVTGRIWAFNYLNIQLRSFLSTLLFPLH